MAELDFIDKQIMRYLFLYPGWHTSNQVADGVGISWITASMHLEGLGRMGYVAKGERGLKTYWKANE